MRRLLYLVGKSQPWLRKLIYKHTGKWYWGLVPFIQDTNKLLLKDSLSVSKRDLILKEDLLDKYLEDIFSYGSKDKIIWITEKGKKQMHDLIDKVGI